MKLCASEVVREIVRPWCSPDVDLQYGEQQIYAEYATIPRPIWMVVIVDQHHRADASGRNFQLARVFHEFFVRGYMCMPDASVAEIIDPQPVKTQRKERFRHL